jgi:ATP-dependent Clp protease, protease subunit
MAAHIIHFYGPVTPASIEELRNCALSGIQEGHADELLISISSEGGNLAAGFTAYHFLRSLPVPVTTHNLGNVESIGVLLFLAGEKRLVVQHGRFTLHALHWGFGSGTVDHDRLAEYTASLDFDVERYAQIFDERTHGASQPVDVRSHLLGRANILASDASVSAGISHSVQEAATPAGAIHWWPPVVKA